jgi:crossover junction endodeoxyribonuclease RuvC
MLVMGIDPGFSGGITILDDKGIICCTAMPVINIEKGRTLDANRIKSLLKTITVEDKYHIFIELVHSMPREGVCSAFNFGLSTGRIIGMIEAYEIPFTKVLPQEWKKHMMAGMDKSDKRLSIIRAMQLQPGFNFFATQQCTKPHDGMAESYLIAEYGRRILGGKNEPEPVKENDALHHNTLNDGSNNDLVV